MKTKNIIVSDNVVTYIDNYLSDKLVLEKDELSDFRKLCEARGIQPLTEKDQGKILYDKLEMTFSRVALSNPNLEHSYLYKIEPIKDDTVLFFSMLIHEFKNPLSAILGLVQAMEAKYKRFPDRFILADYTSRMKDEIKRLNSLLYTAKYMAKPRIRQFIKFDLIWIIKRAIKTLEVSIWEKAAKYKFSSNIDNFEIIGNPDHIHQILANLIKNSLEALKQDGKGKITIEALKRERTFDIIVQDNGSGMNSETLELVQSDFHTTKLDGMGLGLYVIHNILKNYSGKIKIRSTKEKGTTVTISLPISGN